MPEGTHVFLSLGTIPAQAMCLGVEFMKYLDGGYPLQMSPDGSPPPATPLPQQRTEVPLLMDE